MKAQGPHHNHGIFTMLEYSSHLAPKVLDIDASSAGAKVLGPTCWRSFLDRYPATSLTSLSILSPFAFRHGSGV